MYIFETAWEVCNKVGGIYTVLSSKALTMQNLFKDKVFFVGPDIWQENEPLDFEQIDEFSDWKNFVNSNSVITVKIGRWQVPGKPFAILVDFSKIYGQKNDIYHDFWQKFGVNSLNAYGDYDSSSMFGYAVGMVIENFYNFYRLENEQVVAHFNEWQTAFGLLYLKTFLPKIATLFTTHATTIGRSIAGNHKPLYDYLPHYNGDQMSHELNVSAKHSSEKTAAIHADCFTTVSNITACECASLLDKTPDIVTPNGFEDDFVPKGIKFTNSRKKARKILQKVASEIVGYEIAEDALYIGTSGRYEFKNKGIDVFIDALNVVAKQNSEQQIVVFIMVPAWINPEAQQKNRFTTTALMEEHNDLIISALMRNGHSNNERENIKIIFAPVYLNGQDGVFNQNYYDLLIGFDLTVFPSYYEPWGYTPMESAAFAVPTITTNLAGFGQWISSDFQNIDNGIAVIERNDHNYFDVMNNIAEQIIVFVGKTEDERKKIAKQAREIAQKAHWNNFFDYYLKAFEIAVGKK
jgi:glycosyltransferase involved in cell wall biosynthesis